jgi:hypothetical protein
MDDYERHESEAERIDRNWDDLLQELRVSQTGVQILTGFLLTLPIQPSFRTLSTFERDAYVAAITGSIVATGLLITPVAMHRALFHRRRKETLVQAGHRISQVGLFFLAAAVTAVVALVFSLVFTEPVGLGAAVAAALMFLGLWLVLPLGIRRRMVTSPSPSTAADRSTGP